MGILRWLRGGDDNNAAASVISAGLAEIDGLFRPSKHKQTEHVEESKRRRVDVANGAGIDLDRGVAVLRTRPRPVDSTRSGVGVTVHESGDAGGDQAGGDQQDRDRGEE